MFSLTTEAFVFWLLTTCCLNGCFLYPGHPLYEATYRPLQFAHVGFQILGHPLCESFPLQIRHFCFDLQVFAEWPKHWQL